MRLAFYLAVLGAALMWARGFRLALAGGAATGLWYPHWLAVAGALLAIAGIYWLEQFPLPGVLAAILGVLMAFPAGGWLMLPGLILANVWAARRHAIVRLLLGFGLLLPGLMAIFYGLEDWIGRLGRLPLVHAFNRLPGASPLNWMLLGLPPAWLGAWILLPAARTSGAAQTPRSAANPLP